MSEDDFLSRWSRRKREGGDRQPEPDPALRPGAEAPEEPPRSDAQILEDLGLPDPDTLAPGDDVRGFMAEAVPAHLRSRALRRLWRSNPVLACLDGLNDYDEDYTLASTAGQVVQTLYRAGKGFVTHEEEAATRRAVGLPEPAQPPVARNRDDAGEPALDGATEPEALVRAAPAQVAPIPAPVSEPERPEPERPEPERAELERPEPERPGPRRRMRFTAPGDDSAA